MIHSPFRVCGSAWHHTLVTISGIPMGARARGRSSPSRRRRWK
jgi:hypothetical protein